MPAGKLVGTVIGNSYLDDPDFDNLGDYLSAAAQTGTEDAAWRGDAGGDQ
jgi:hypothetical protein